MNDIVVKDPNSSLRLHSLHSLDEVKQMAKSVSASGMFGDRCTPDQALVLLMMAQARGLHPMIAMEKYHIIEGRPAKKADAMLAEFQMAGGKIKWVKYENEVCEAVFTFNGDDLTVKWTIQMAREAGLVYKFKSGAPNNWLKYPRQMLKARVISEGVRAICPNATEGLYLPEEVQDIRSEKEINPLPDNTEAVEGIDPLVKVQDSVIKVTEPKGFLEVLTELDLVKDKVGDEAYTKARWVIDEGARKMFRSRIEKIKDIAQLQELDNEFESLKILWHPNSYNKGRELLTKKADSIMNNFQGQAVGGVMGTKTNMSKSA